MIEELVEPTVAAVEAFDDLQQACLYPEEEKAVADAVTKRRQEFGTARWCARVALAKLGLPPAAILPGSRGAPQWPPGVVGSITHCAGYRAAALGHSRDVAAIGIDAEPHSPLPEGVGALVTRPEEAAQMAELGAAAPDICWDKVLFSAKESVYKTWYPLTGLWLGFGDVSVAFDRTSGSFVARLVTAGPWIDGREITSFSGRWLIRNGLVVTAVVTPAG